jgi:hypothetical protein
MGSLLMMCRGDRFVAGLLSMATGDIRQADVPPVR